MMQCAAENTLTHIPQYDMNDCDQVVLGHACPSSDYGQLASQWEIRRC